MPPTPFEHDGQAGWAHDGGHAGGTFHTYDALALGAPRKVHLFLPRTYARGDRRYPTVWFLDGHTAFWPGGVARNTWDVPGVLSQPGAPEVIAIAVHPLERDAEYTHADWYHGERPWGGLPAHAAWLATVLKPWIDAGYRTEPGRTATTIIGSSHGGLAAFWTATRHPDAFGAAGCLSPSFFTGLDSLRHGRGPGRLEEAPIYADVRGVLRDPARRPRLWIDWGGRRDGGEHNAVVEALAAARGAEMIALLERDGYDREVVAPGELPRSGAALTVCVDPRAGHDEDAWRARLPAVLRALVT